MRGGRRDALQMVQEFNVHTDPEGAEPPLVLLAAVQRLLHVFYDRQVPLDLHIDHNLAILNGVRKQSSRDWACASWREHFRNRVTEDCAVSMGTLP